MVGLGGDWWPLAGNWWPLVVARWPLVVARWPQVVLPALPHPLSAALMPAEEGAGAILIWSRPAKRSAIAA